MRKVNWRTKAVYLLIAAVLAIGLVPMMSGVASVGAASSITCYITADRTFAPVNGLIDLKGVTNVVTPDAIIWGGDTGTPAPVGLDPAPMSWSTSGLKVITMTIVEGELSNTAMIAVLIDDNLLEPGYAHNILGAWETFTVPDGDTRTVLGWRVEEQTQIDVTWTEGQPGDRSINVHCAALGSEFEGGAAYIYADMTPAAGMPAYYRAEKKWGKINYTVLLPWEVENYKTVIGDGSSEVTWNESAKTWEGGILVTEAVFGSYDTNEGIIHVLADGGIVNWWLLDGTADVSLIPDSGNFATLAGVIGSLPDANLATFPNGATFIQTGTVGGVAAMPVLAWGEESIYVVVVVNYPDGLSQGGQYPVFPEIISWNFWTQQVEKVPQVRWAGEEIVLEKQFGVSYAGFAVDFVIEGNSPGALESLGYPGDENEGGVIHTRVQPDGVARCILGSEEPGEADVTCLLYDLRGTDELPGSGSQYGEEILINKHGFVVFFLKLESLTLGNVLGERMYHNDGLFMADPIYGSDKGPWNAAWDSTSDTLNVSADTLLRARVKGWFMGDDLSTRPEAELDTDGDGETDITLPKGRWVLPDDWYKLGGGLLWEELRPHWDIMDNPFDNVMSDADYTPFDMLGDFVGWGHGNGIILPRDVDVILYPVAFWPVIGPYSTLDNYTPFVNPLLGRKTIVPNGVLDMWDCPMPPAKIVFELIHSTDIGYFKEVDKRDVYYHFINFTNDLPGPESIAFTNPFYATMIPASPFLPPFLNNGGYDWDSWDPAYGPYFFWEFINQPDQGPARADPTHPTKVEVYSDNHGEAMVWLNGDWNLNINGQGAWWDDVLGDWTTEPWIDVKTGDPWLPIGWEAWTHIVSQGGVVAVGVSHVIALADYPCLRKHQPIASGTVEKTWTWGKAKYVDVYQLEQIQGAPLYGQKLVLVWLTDRDGMPAVGEEIIWKLPNNGATILGFLSGTDGVIIDPLQKVGVSETRPATLIEIAYWVASHGDLPCPGAVAGVIILGTDPTIQSTLLIEMYEREGILYHAEVLDFGIPGQVDPELVAGINTGVYEGPTQSVVDATSSIASNLVAIWWQDADGEWHAYAPGAPAWANDLSELSFGNVYWINVSQNCLWNWEFS